eukprot:COSAG01_NODE_13130_length_1631_cov_1.015666_2_plen_340_part_00
MARSYPELCGSGRRRRLAHLGTEPIAEGYEMTYDECFACHAKVTPSYCAPTCCPPGSHFGDQTCASSEQQKYHGLTDMMADKVRRECMQFETYAMAKALYTQITGLVSQASELRDALVVIEQTANYARSAVSNCAQAAHGVAAAFTTNAGDLLAVYQCQALITAELRRIAEECLDAKAGILIPWYGVIKYWDSPCISFAPNWDTADSSALDNDTAGNNDHKKSSAEHQSTSSPKLLRMGQCLIGGILSTLLSTFIGCKLLCCTRRRLLPKDKKEQRERERARNKKRRRKSRRRADHARDSMDTSFLDSMSNPSATEAFEMDTVEIETEVSIDLASRRTT